jgi:hypothetical protein
MILQIDGAGAFVADPVLASGMKQDDFSGLYLGRSPETVTGGTSRRE